MTRIRAKEAWTIEPNAVRLPVSLRRRGRQLIARIISASEVRANKCQGKIGSCPSGNTTTAVVLQAGAKVSSEIGATYLGFLWRPGILSLSEKENYRPTPLSMFVWNIYILFSKKPPKKYLILVYILCAGLWRRESSRNAAGSYGKHPQRRRGEVRRLIAC